VIDAALSLIDVICKTTWSWLMQHYCW